MFQFLCTSTCLMRMSMTPIENDEIYEFLILLYNVVSLLSHVSQYLESNLKFRMSDCIDKLEKFV